MTLPMYHTVFRNFVSISSRRLTGCYANVKIAQEKSLGQVRQGSGLNAMFNRQQRIEREADKHDS